MDKTFEYYTYRQVNVSEFARLVSLQLQSSDHDFCSTLADDHVAEYSGVVEGAYDDGCTVEAAAAMLDILFDYV